MCGTTKRWVPHTREERIHIFSGHPAVKLRPDAVGVGMPGRDPPARRTGPWANRRLHCAITTGSRSGKDQHYNDKEKRRQYQVHSVKTHFVSPSIIMNRDLKLSALTRICQSPDNRAAGRNPPQCVTNHPRLFHCQVYCTTNIRVVQAVDTPFDRQPEVCPPAAVQSPAL